MRTWAWIGIGAVAVAAAAWGTAGLVERATHPLAHVGAAWGSAASRELEVSFGPCSLPWEATAIETDAMVTVEVVLEKPLQWGASCTDEAAIVVLTLEEPLGDRSVVDASTGRTITVHGRDDDGPS